MVVFYRLLTLGLLVTLWQLAADHVQRNLIPSPLETLDAAIRLTAEGKLPDAVADSLTVYLLGYFAAASVAIPIGLFMGTIRTLGRTLDIYVFALAATPRVAFIPLIILFLGLGMEAKVFVVFLGATMPILINTYAGVLAADEELIEMARSVGATQRRVFARIVLPGALPFIVTGLRIGATIGLINTVVAELYTSIAGLGGLLALYGNTFRMAEYFVIVLTLALIGVVVTETLRYIEIRLERWKSVN